MNAPIRELVRLTAPIASAGDAERQVTVDVDLDHGGRIAQITVGAQPLLVDVPTDVDARADGLRWGSYPMAPWAGRVRSGTFRYFDVDHHLRLNQDDSGVGAAERRHAMHGTVLDARWTIDEQTDSMLAISCPLDQAGSGWPFGGVAHQRIEVLDHQVRCDLGVVVDHHHDHRHRDHRDDPDAGAEHRFDGHHHHVIDDPNAGLAPDEHRGAGTFLAEIGWHPWWRKPDRLSFHPDAMYERDGVGLPTGRLVAPSAGPWDDCFVNTAPVILHYDGADVADLTLSSDCDHWVIYDHPDHATCVEPQSGPPDAFNIRPQIVTATHPLRRTMIVGW